MFVVFCLSFVLCGLLSGVCCCLLAAYGVFDVHWLLLVFLCVACWLLCVVSYLLFAA